MRGFSELRIQQIEALVEIEDKSERDCLLFDLVMKFCIEDHNDHSAGEQTLFGDILVRLMQNLNAEKKIEVADKIATSQAAPVKIVRYLALEPIEIAEAILAHSPVLTDNDLLVVINIRGYGHMIAIASRENLSTSISAALVKYGDETVWVSLVENNGAKISDKSFQKLSKKAKSSEPVLQTLLSRSDIPSFIMRRIVVDTGEPIRPFLLSNGLHYLISFLDEERARLESESQILVSVDELQETLRTLLQNRPGKKFDESDFLSVIEADDFTKIVCVFSSMTRIPLKKALELLTRRDAEPAVLACRAIGLKRDTLAALLTVGPWKLSLAPESRRKFLNVFDKLKPAIARAVLKMRLKVMTG